MNARMEHFWMLSKTALCCGLLLVGAFGLSGSVHAQNAETDNTEFSRLDDAMQSLAKSIKAYLDGDQRVSNISIGAITGPPQLAAGTGITFKKKLVDALTELGVGTEKKRVRTSAKGEFFFDEQDQKLRLQIAVRDGNITVQTYDLSIFDVEDIASLTGATGALDPKDLATRGEDLVEAVTAGEATLEENPTVGPNEIALAETDPPAGKSVGSAKPKPKPKTLVLAQADGQYAVEICVLRGGIYKPLPVVNDEGLAFVDLKSDDIYAVRLINRTDKAAAVTLSIDGLNMFEFSKVPGYRSLGKVIIHPREEGYLIKGWHLTDEQVAQFQVTDYANSAKAAILGQSGGALEADEAVGTITASFALAIPAGQPFPQSELAQKSLGTRLGPTVSDKFTSERMSFGLVKEIISVRYSRPLPEA